MIQMTKKETENAKIIQWLYRYDDSLFFWLIFSFFFLAPFPFVSEFTSTGKVFFTIYDLPKYVFLCPAAFFISFCFVLSLSYHQKRWQQTKAFIRKNLGVKLLAFFFALQALSLTSALVWQNALLQLAIYFSFIQLFVVLAILFQKKHFLYASLFGTVLSLLIFCPLGFLQFFNVQLPFLRPISGPAATLGYRNPAAHYLVLNLPFAVYLAYHFRQKSIKKSHPGRRLFMIFLFAFLSLMALIHTFMTTTRTAILALLLYSFLLPIFCLLQHKKKEAVSARIWLKTIVATLAAGILIAGCLMTFPQSRSRVMKSVRNVGSLSILEGRRYHWGNTLYMIKKHPLLGVGLGNWQFAYPLFMHSYAKDTCFTFKVQVKKSHNDYLQIAAESGVGALFIFLLLWGRQFYLVWEIDHKHDNPNFQCPLFCSLLAFSVIMMFSFPLQMGYSRMFFFYLLAMGESSA